MEYIFETLRSVVEISWFSIAVLGCLTVLVIVYLNTRRDPRVPPGPRLYPIIGNLSALFGNDILGNLRHLRTQFGDVFGLYIGTELTIFLNGYDVIHNALVKQGSLFSQRPISNLHRRLMKYPGIIFMNGKIWKEQRAFALTSLSDICFKNGGAGLEEIVHCELEHLINHLREIHGPVHINDYIYRTFGNIICMVVYRHRFGFQDKNVDMIMNYFRETTKGFQRMTILSNCFPYLYHLPGDLLGIRRTIRGHEEFRNGFMPLVSEPSSPGPSVLQIYKEAIESKAHTDSSFNEHQMKSTLFDLLGTGMDTSSVTIIWAILHLVRNQDVQRNMFEEIKTVIGVDRKPEIKDKPNLPYSEAVILEVMRLSTVAPLGVPHTVSRDTILDGYLLPENCTILINIDSSLKDQTVWRDPEEFQPERFLNPDRTRVDIPKEFIPFSTGPRSCLGETLARLETFMFLTTLVQNFQFSPGEDSLPKTEGELGLVWHPLPFTVRIAKR